MSLRRGWLVSILVLVLLAPSSPIAAGATASRRIAFLVDSWYPWSHADVIGRRLLEGYRVGDRVYTSPLTVSSVHIDAPSSRDVTPTMARRYGFRIATSIADALLEDSQSSRPRLAVDGIFIATREDLPGSGVRRQSPNRRVQVVREVLMLMDRAGTRLPIFIDKMLAGTWEDSQTIVAEAARRGVPLMAGSVLPFTPLDRPLRRQGIEVGVVVASTPYWAFGFHAAELLQGFMEQRAPRETGIAEIRDVGAAYIAMPDRDRWGGRVFDALWASARTRRSRVPPVPGGLRPDTHALLIRYADGTRGVLALISEVIDDSEFLLGAQYADGTTEASGLVLKGEPFDHFGYLVHALVAFYTTGRAPVPVERTLLTSGLTLFGQQAHQSGQPMATPGLAISYPSPRPRP